MKPSEEVPGRPAAGAGEDEAFNGPSLSAIEAGPDGPVFAGGIWGVDVAEDEDVCLRVLSGGEMMFFSSRISKAERIEVRLTRYSSARTRSEGRAVVCSPF